MATVYETEVEIDAPANINTGHSISVGDEFFGRLRAGGEDWILVNLLAGRTYVIELAGDGRGDPDRPGSPIDALSDPVLRIYDNGGNLLAMNDDVDGVAGNLGSRLNFQPAEDGVYFLSAGAFDKADNNGNYRLSLRETRVTIEAREDEDGNVPESAKLVGSDQEEALLGLGGNDILEGRGGDDVLRGRGGDDVLIGGAGADALRGGFGSDTASYQGSPEGVTVSLEDGEATGGHAQDDDIGTDIENLRGSDFADDLTGNARNNRLYGDGGNDELNGRDDNDELSGGAGDDDLDGGDDDDTLEGGPGADSLEGGHGSDTASYAGSRAPVDVRLHDGGIFRGGDAEGDTFFRVVDGLADIEHLTGSGGADTLAGDSRNNEIRGGGGDDVLYGGPGAAEGRVTNADRLYGGEGNDQLFGGPGADTLDGGNGDDVLSGGSGADSYVGGDGNDLIYADHADSAALDVDGGDGRDTLTFERVDRDLSDLRAQGAISVDLSGDGITSIEILIGSQDDDMLTGTNDNPETIEGGDGNDMLNGGAGPGDTLSYAGSNGPVDVDLDRDGGTAGAQPVASGSHARGDTIVTHDLSSSDNTPVNSFENLRGSGFGDFLKGDAMSNIIEGGPGADDLDGGLETMDDPDSDDWLSYASSSAGVVVDLDSRDDGSNRPSASGGDAEGDNIEPGTFENIMGGLGNDRLTGDKGNNILYGGPGADHLDGGTFTSEDIASRTDDDQDNDVPEDMDIATYRFSAEGVTVDLFDGDESAGDAEGDTFDNIELYEGSDHDDTFILPVEVTRDNAGDITEISSPMVDGGGGTNTVSYKDFQVEVDDNGEQTMRFVIEITIEHDGETLDNGVVRPGSDFEVGAHYLSVANSPPGNGETNSATQNYIDENNIDPFAFHEGDSIQIVEGTEADDLMYVRVSSEAMVWTLRGLGGDDILIGGFYSEMLYGGAGNDIIEGGTGTDLVDGGDGNDSLSGGRGDEMDILDADGNIMTRGGVYGGPGDDFVTGHGGDDYVNGGPGDDEVAGDKFRSGGQITGGGLTQPGDDILEGGPGDDDLNGGRGDDIFIFGPGHGNDFVEDFDAAGDDTLDLSAFASAIEDWYLDNFDTELNLSDGVSDEEFAQIAEMTDGGPNFFIEARGGTVVIDLTAFGGGRIVLESTTIEAGSDDANELNPGDLDFMA